MFMYYSCGLPSGVSSSSSRYSAIKSASASWSPPIRSVGSRLLSARAIEAEVAMRSKKGERFELNNSYLAIEASSWRFFSARASCN